MLAMQYAFEFGIDADMDAVRRRIVDRGPAFDGYPGLVEKAFLLGDTALGDARNEYAAFYLWDDAAAARDFLQGEAFEAVSAAFGRPRVRLWPVLAHRVSWRDPAAPPRFALRRLAPVKGGQHALDGLPELPADADGHPPQQRVLGLDPERWETVDFSLWHAAPSCDGFGATGAHCYRVEYVARAARPAPPQPVAAAV